MIAVDSAAEELALAREIGADETVASGDGAAEEIRELTGGRGAELVLDLVGADDTLALGRLGRPFEGHLTVVGLGRRQARVRLRRAALRGGS